MKISLKSVHELRRSIHSVIVFQRFEYFLYTIKNFYYRKYWKKITINTVKLNFIWDYTYIGTFKMLSFCVSFKTLIDRQTTSHWWNQLYKVHYTHYTTIYEQFQLEHLGDIFVSEYHARVQESMCIKTITSLVYSFIHHLKFHYNVYVL